MLITDSTEAKCVMLFAFSGEPGSSVFGSVIDGVFEGKIMSHKGSYYVEKARHYFPQTALKNNTFHSVIYHENHIEDPYEHLRVGKLRNNNNSWLIMNNK